MLFNGSEIVEYAPPDELMAMKGFYMFTISLVSIVMPGIKILDTLLIDLVTLAMAQELLNTFIKLVL